MSSGTMCAIPKFKQAVLLDTPPISPKTLPKSRAILEMMFKHCDLCIARAKNTMHRNAQKVRLLFDLDDGKIKVDELVARTRQIDEVHQKDRDTIITEIEDLWPYCESELIDAAAQYLSQGEMAIVGGQKVNNEERAMKFAASSASLMLGQRQHITALQRLKLRVFNALESESADTGADIETFLAKTAPRNDDIATLHLKIIREQRSGKSENEIALDFTEGDKKRSASLLRGVRRYRERLSAK